MTRPSAPCSQSSNYYYCYEAFEDSKNKCERKKQEGQTIEKKRGGKGKFSNSSKRRLVLNRPSLAITAPTGPVMRKSLAGLVMDKNKIRTVEVVMVVWNNVRHCGCGGCYLNSLAALSGSH